MGFNPLFWLHFHLTGGWRNNVAIALAYVGLIALAAAFLYQLDDGGPPGAISSVCLGFITAAQGLFALLLGPGAIRRAVLRDFQSGMIESHRLAPMSGLRVVAGYMTGPPIQAAWLWGVGILVGTYFAVDVARNISPLVVTGWYTVQLCVLLLALMLAALVLLMALSSAGRTNILGVAVLITVLGGWMAVPFVPGLALITGVISGGELLAAFFQGGPTAVSADMRSVFLAGAAQLAFAAIFLRAACRKVRAPERAMFSMPLGLLLAAVWAATLIVGVARMPASHWLVREYGDIAVVQLVASTAALVLVAMFPLVAAANECFQVDRAAGFGVATGGWRRVALLMPLLLAVLAMVTLVLMFGYLYERRYALFGVSPPPALVQALTSTWLKMAMLAALILWLWIDFNWLYCVVARGKRVFVAVLLLVLVLRILPLAADLTMQNIRSQFESQPRFVDQYFAGFSPIGTLVLCTSEDGNPWPGLGGQLVLAAGATWLGWRVRKELLRGARGP